MNIDISDILESINKESTKEVELTLDTFSSRLGDFPITQKAPVKLHIANIENAKIEIDGSVDLVVGTTCARCLESAPTSMHIDIQKSLSIVDGVPVDDDMEETDYLIGLELDVDRLVYGEILVNWPMRVLCKDDCEGICKVCGMNLNKGACNCQRTELDPRMAAIQDIFQQFKEV